MGIVEWAVPMVLPLRRRFLKDILAVRTEDVVPKTEILVEEHCTFGHSLVAVGATFFVRAEGYVVGHSGMSGSGSRGFVGR